MVAVYDGSPVNKNVLLSTVLVAVASLDVAVSSEGPILAARLIETTPIPS